MDQLQQQQQVPESAVFRTVFSYVLLILFVPVAAFFASKSLLFQLVLGLDASTSTLYAAGVAVVAVHASLGLYVVRAFREPEKGGKRD
ncbi:vacuolar ATPase assembly integral membrane protein vma21-like [Pollicipes pollicipes]|uniref:vacuolar ATPase assembly integral membrane protein vma21-like n=1 Tax=Pollicipes pollicipes TaxID=41117 RepID=UPI0018857EA4|nr:vacuolar ATPase assembly integral membrane protein vma21-like [Pollicipes pollicipes]XP_037075893.1 vacuolar ATPase assembly integral membrane protein vma21-like [Pollicipes pollicipes]XP_037075894.1 vacuolar ATPase assembly integral membrane protein vma21-like [Pollicipes pollicipes]